ncbi:MAG: hypothetical protein R2811_00600 [Flavobacteriales bacterium]
MRRVVVLLILGFPCLSTFAQKGEVQLNVSPQRGMEYILDGRERLTNRALVLTAGDHRFTFWAPDRRILDTTLTIIADTSIAFYKTLAPTAEYLSFQRDLKRVKHQRFYYRAVPLLATVVGGVFTLNAMKQNNETYDALQAAEDEYASFRDPVVIATHKTTVLPRLQEKHDAANTQLRTTMAITSVAALATIWGFIKAARVEEPTYEDKERLRFEGLVWLPGPRGGSLQAGIMYRFHG